MAEGTAPSGSDSRADLAASTRRAGGRRSSFVQPVSSSSSGSGEPKREGPPRAAYAGPVEESGTHHTGSLVLYPARVPPRGENLRTMVSPLALPPARSDFRQLFVDAYAGGIRAVGRARADVGIAVFAIDRHSGALASSMAISGRPGRVLGAVVGRHDQADLRLVEDPWIANRQLAVLVHPLTSWEPDRLRYSVIDLRTHHPMISESGAELASLVAEGPFIAQLGRYALYVLPTGDPTDFPDRGEDAWDMLPERVLLDRRAPVANANRVHEARNVALDALRAARPRVEPRVSRDRSSVITSIGPLMKPDERLRARDEPVVGELEVMTEDARAVYAVGARALERGILLGRLPRCDGAGVLSRDRISRAHLLIKRVESVLIALDTASTNGTVMIEPGLLAGPVRVSPLGDAARLVLAEQAEVRWRGRS